MVEGVAMTDYQHEWRELCEDSTLTESERLAIGFELWNTMLADPVYQYRMLRRERAIAREKRREEAERIAAMPVVERLVFAHERGETWVILSDVQAHELASSGMPAFVDVEGGDDPARTTWIVHVRHGRVALMLQGVNMRRIESK